MTGELNPESLPSVLHEGTHHWCFLSPLGLALSLLYYSGVGTTIEFGDDRESHDKEISDAVKSLMRYEQASRILAPIIEGLALFAEFDLPGTSPDVWPLPLTWAHGLFGGKTSDEPDLDKVFARVRELLTEMRSSDQLIGRKISVLLGSGDAGKNPYLAGYLTVKWAWHATANQRREFADQDVFFVFLRHYIFCDPELVRLLHAPFEEFDRMFAVRLQKRMLGLTTNVKNMSIKPKGKLLWSLENEEWQYGGKCDRRTIGVTEEECRRGEAALASSVADLERLAHDERRDQSVWQTIIDVVNERDAFVLDRCDVNVEINSSGVLRVNYSPETLTFFTAGHCPITRLHGTHGTGYATMLLSRTSGSPYFAVCYDGEILKRMCRGSPDEAEEARLRALALGVGRTAELTAAWQHYSDQWTDSTLRSMGLSKGAPDSPQTWFDARLPEVNEVVSCLYRLISIPPWNPAEKYAEATHALSTRGVAGLFPPNRIRLLPVMAGWSLGGASDRHLKAFLSTLAVDETLGEVFDEVNHWAKRCWDADLFVFKGDELHTVTI
ncbi:hypothetical protein [Rhizobium ruizarguesonis]|uniref:hypothetical protein n=1 Tax=Rhizobium ruizarguesonis TaxID=2081791 RepID=UPI00102FCAE9|nr:hypothetical protein [Rhizobium ruizarguesonis]TAZ44251.1 hypothetical protein ELH76_35940 [Rhizobium ruizarguesonis]